MRCTIRTRSVRCAAYSRALIFEGSESLHPPNAGDAAVRPGLKIPDFERNV
jgi:hypothetical protein